PKARIRGIGVCLPGAVNTAKGVVPVSPHLEGWAGFPLAEKLSRKFRLPVRLANDANAAALAEKLFGAGRGVAHFIYMTVSTGVGGGIVSNGKLLEGVSFVAGEVGHMTVEPRGEKWKLGEVGVLEAYASGTAVARYVRSRVGTPAGLKKYRDPGGQVSARAIGAQAARGDRLALGAYERAGFYLGVGVANLLNILNPEKLSWEGACSSQLRPFFGKPSEKPAAKNRGSKPTARCAL
ncbi:MAG: ROK family protein, partial [Candidatus Omnitrophota bacterium]